MLHRLCRVTIRVAPSLLSSKGGELLSETPELLRPTSSENWARAAPRAVLGMDTAFVNELKVALTRLDLAFALGEINREEWVDRHDSLVAWVEAREASMDEGPAHSPAD